MRIDKVLVFLFFMVSSQIFGQHYTHKLPVNKVSKSGWYMVELPANFLAVSNPNGNDVRLLQEYYADSIVQVPYFIEQTKGASTSEWYEAFEWRKLANNSYIIQHNLPSIDELHLKVSNHADAFYFSLSGSMNGKDWFSIRQKMLLSPSMATNKTWEWTHIQFPLVSYPYLRIQFLDSNTLPVQMLEAGVYRNQSKAVAMRKVEKVQWIQELNPSEKITRIKVYSPYKQVADKLMFEIKSPALYQRHVEMYRKIKETRKGKTIFRSEPICNFELHAKAPLFLHQKIELSDTLYIDIYNQDNQALQIEDVHFMRYPTLLYTYLEKGMQPVLFTGNKQLQAPQYDILSFADEKDKAQNLGIGEMVVLKEAEKVELMPKQFYETKTFMWICLATGMVVLGWFAFKMMPSGRD